MYVVTGGAGFIGSNLLAALEERGDGELVVVDRLRSNDKWRNLAKREIAEIVAPEHLFDFLAENRGKIKMVFHMGAISSTTETDADLIVTNNFKLTSVLFDWCARHGVRMVYASSAATYGDGSQGFDDDFGITPLSLLQPLNAYGWSKHLFDRRLARKVADHATVPPQWAGLKFFNVYGPNEYHKGSQQSVVSHTYLSAQSGGPAHLFRSHNPSYEDGGQMRDFVWVADVVSVMTWLLDHEAVNGLFNLGSGQARSFLDLANSVYRAMGKEPYIKFIDTPEAIREKYQYFTEARMGRLKACGYNKPFTSLEDGVSAYVNGFLSRPDQYR